MPFRLDVVETGKQRVDRQAWRSLLLRVGCATLLIAVVAAPGMVGKKRLGSFGPVQVFESGCPVGSRHPLMLVRIARPGRC